jgi:hypothetical protein
VSHRSQGIFGRQSGVGDDDVVLWCHSLFGLSCATRMSIVKYS